MVSRIRETLKIPTPSPNMWARDSTQHKDSEDVTKLGTSVQRVLELPQWVQWNLQGSLQEVDWRVRGREKDPTALQTASSCHIPSKSRPFQTSCWFCRRRKNTHSRRPCPALPAPGKLTLLLEAGESQSRLAPLTLKMGEPDFLLPTTD